MEQESFLKRIMIFSYNFKLMGKEYGKTHLITNGEGILYKYTAKEEGERILNSHKSVTESGKDEHYCPEVNTLK